MELKDQLSWTEFLKESSKEEGCQEEGCQESSQKEGS